MSYGTFPATNDLAYLIAAVNSTFVDTVTILRTALVPGPDGGVTNTFAPQYTNVPCRILPIGAEALRTREQVAGGALLEVTVFLCVFPIGTDISHKDRVQKGNLAYEVIGVDFNRSRGTSVHALLKLIKAN